MRIAFLSEMGFQGKIPATHENMRTEFAWMNALDADHWNIRQWPLVSGYDYVMIIFPKGGVFLNSEGSTLVHQENRYTDVFASNIVEDLKKTNKKVCSVQEGPTWFVNDFELKDQFNLYNQLASCDILFAHNEYDTKWFKGLYPRHQVEVMPTLLIEELIKDIVPTPQNKVIIGGNFSRWYGGFQSYMACEEIPYEKYVQTSHSSRDGEDQIPDLTVLPRMYWFEWMKTLSTFKYAVHMMPTVAAGTFSLNCAYFGIPCIGNCKVDTQRLCFPDLSVEAEDVQGARELAKGLFENEVFYKRVSEEAKKRFRRFFGKEVYLEKLNKILV